MAESAAAPAAALRAALERARTPSDRAAADTRIAVALSGGLDSMVLLDVASEVLGAGRLTALHVHHGIQPEAECWLAHCQAAAALRGVRFDSMRLRLDRAAEGPARVARMRALHAMAMRAGARILLFAHHADDQIETVLLHLGRGAGLRGLTGIPMQRDFRGVLLLRPWLTTPRALLIRHARERGLGWIEDPSNADTRLRRNAVRLRLMPVWREIFPGGETNLLRFAALAGDALHAFAGSTGGSDQPLFDRRVPARLQAGARALWLRGWLDRCGLRVPTAARLAEMDRQLLMGTGPHAEIRHDGVVLRRWRDRVEIDRSAHAPASPEPPVAQVVWRGEARVGVPAFAGELGFEEIRDGSPGIPVSMLLGRTLSLQPMRLSASLRLRVAGPSRSIRKLCQQHGVAPWERRRLPMVLVDGRLLHVAGLGTDAWWLQSEAPGITRIALRWHPL